MNFHIHYPWENFPRTIRLNIILFLGLFMTFSINKRIQTPPQLLQMCWHNFLMLDFLKGHSTFTKEDLFFSNQLQNWINTFTSWTNTTITYYKINTYASKISKHSSHWCPMLFPRFCMYPLTTPIRYEIFDLVHTIRYIKSPTTYTRHIIILFFNIRQ